MDVADVVAIVTGGASGIGEASAKSLAQLGARCVIVDRNEQAGREVASSIGGAYVNADVTSEAEMEAVIEQAKDLGPIRVLVNAAGIGRAERVLSRDGSPSLLAGFDLVLRVNLLGTFNCIRLVASAMAASEPTMDSGRGVIVNLASIAAFDGQIGQAAYSASKGGVVGMTLPIARDLASVGIRVNTIAPGLIDTPIYGHGEKAEAFKARLAEGVLFPRRLGFAEELASMVTEVVRNDYVNGETIRVDGGIRLPPR